MPNAHRSRRELFAQGVARGLTATKAYIEAGCSKNGAGAGASRLLADPDVSARIGELSAEQEVNGAATELAIEWSPVTKDWVRRRLVEIVEHGLALKVSINRQTGKPITIEGPDGETCFLASFEPREAIRALELLGKDRGMFIERQVRKEVSDLENMSIEELEAIADGTHPSIREAMARIEGIKDDRDAAAERLSARTI